MRVLIYAVIFLTLIMAGCKQKVNEPEVGGGEQADQEVNLDAKQIELELINEDGVGVGLAMIRELDKGVEIELEAHHLQPGLHGFHIHERGLCEAPTFESAGGHFNPTNKAHGFDHPEGHHAGDMENIEVKEDGTVRASLTNEALSLKKDADNSLLQQEGTSLVIHADADDYISQPAGDAGKRIVCGVISMPEDDKKS